MEYKSAHKPNLKAITFTILALFLLSAGATGNAEADCVFDSLADIPLDARMDSPPGLIMFLIDDSGSMDFATMVEDKDYDSLNFFFTGGMFLPPSREGVNFSDHSDGVAYVFDNPGDQQFAGRDLEGDEHLYWQSQYSGINKMYYNPDSTYKPWPKWDSESVNNDAPSWSDPNTDTDALDMEPDTPRSNPMDDSYTFDMNGVFYAFDPGTVIVDDDDSGFWINNDDGDWNTDYTNDDCYHNYCPLTDFSKECQVEWEADVDTNEDYEIYARWSDFEERGTEIPYRIHHSGGETVVEVNQQVDISDETGQEWMKLTDQTFNFSSRKARITIGNVDGDDPPYKVEEGENEVCADAVAFVPASNVRIRNAHYYVKNENGVYLVNMEGAYDSGDFGYYEVIDSDDDGKADQFNELTKGEADSAGIVTGRSYEEERVNFANWYSFYRKRELTAKNAIASVATSMEDVFIGLESINGDLGQEILPINVTHDGTYVDETDYLLSTLYNDWNSSGGTPLRAGLNYVGEYFSGDHVPNDIYEINGRPYTESDFYPFFRESEGGYCEQAFTIAMTDGFWNGNYWGVGDADADTDNEFDGGIYHGDASNTLADIAMYYYKNDLNTNLSNHVPTTDKDTANHQHMVTYGVSFGANGTLDPEAYDCDPGASTCSESEDDTSDCCPIWPDPGNDDNPRKIDDLYHASVNGRGSFINASTPEQLIAAMKELQNLISSRLGSAAAAASNSIQVKAGTKIYQGIYHSSNWRGDLIQYSVDPVTGEIQDENEDRDWSAAEQLEDRDEDDRVIITYDGSTGVPFRHGQSVLPEDTYTEALVAYLRGENANNTEENFRVRSSKLGDVVHSAPYFHNDVIYVGANDGMLHAFDKENGNELFAYVPKILIDAGTLPDLAAMDYTHQFYVDNTVHVRSISDSTTLLVGGLRKGGKGYYALDVSALSDSPSEDDASNIVKWEYTADEDDDLGYSYSQAYIANTHAAGWVVIFSNGYDSVNQKAVLYVLDINDSTGNIEEVIKIDTNPDASVPTGDCNGLSSPALIDYNSDGYLDYVYAGDLNGNMWKFDFSGDEKSDWQIAYNDGTDPKPLITVKNDQGGQPITLEPNVMKMDCSADQQGYLVVFGTGRYIGENDALNDYQQTFYGIWDWQDAFDNSPETQYLGEFNADEDSPSLSNEPVYADSLTLREQTLVNNIQGYRIMSDNPIEWFEPPEGDDDFDTDYAGWYFNLVDPGARVIQDPLIRPGTGGDVGVVTFVSSVPSVSECGGSAGHSWLYQVSACNGGRTADPHFDTNDDNVVNADDMLDDDVSDSNPPDIPPSGKEFDDMLYRPVQVGSNLYINTSSGEPPEQVKIPDNMEGLFYWRQIE